MSKRIYYKLDSACLTTYNKEYVSLILGGGLSEKPADMGRKNHREEEKSWKSIILKMM